MQASKSETLEQVLSLLQKLCNNVAGQVSAVKRIKGLSDDQMMQSVRDIVKEVKIGLW